MAACSCDGCAPACPTLRGLGRALTLHSGAICAGSLLMAMLHLARYLFKKAKNTSCKSLKCLILCLLGCAKVLVETFNEFAYVQVGCRLRQ